MPSDCRFKLVISILLVIGGAGALARPASARSPFAPAVNDSLRGSVVDTARAPLPGAIVTLVELGRSVTTDPSGAFLFVGLPPQGGRYTMVVRCLGYAAQTRQVDLAAGEALTLVLAPSTLRLEPIVVTATRSAIDPLASPLPTQALSGERLRREQEVSLAHAIDGLSGVRTLSTGEQVGKPVIRGLSGPRTLVLDNGLRLEDYSWSDEDGPSVDARLAERVEVIRGPASVLYGSDALGGVINIVGDEIPDARGRAGFTRVSADAYGGTNNTELGGTLRLEGAEGPFGWRFTGIGRRASNIHTPTGNPQTPTGDIYDTGFHSINGEIAVGVHGEKAGATLRYERYGGDFDILDGPPVPDDNVSGPLRRLADNRVQGTTNWVLGTTRLEIKSQWQGHSLKEVVGDSRVADDPPSFDLLLNTFTTDILLHHARGDWLSGTIGVSGLFQNNKTRGVFPLVPAARTSDGAIFAFEQASWSRWSVLLGARGDAHHIATDSNMDLQLPSQVLNASAFSGDAGVVYRPVAGLAVAANIGRAFRAPTLFELFSNGPHLGEDRFEIGLATARPEVSFNADLSLRWERPRFRGEIAVYRNSIEHYLYIEPNGATAVVTEDDGTVDTLDVYQYKQTSRAVLQGLDLSTEIEAIPALTLRGRFDFVHGDNDATAQPLPLMPPARVDLEADLHTVSGGPSGRSYVTLATQIVAKQTRLGQFDTSTEGYALLHLGGGVAPQLWGRRVFLDIRVRNALNQRYNDFLSRYKLFAYEMGRNVVVRVSTGI